MAPKIIGGWAFGSLHSLCLCAAEIWTASVVRKLMASVAPKIIGGWAFVSLHSLCLCAAEI